MKDLSSHVENCYFPCTEYSTVQIVLTIFCLASIIKGIKLCYSSFFPVLILAIQYLWVHCCYVHVCFVQVTTCGAPDTLTCLGAAHFSTVISPSWITEQISVGKCIHRGASALWEHQTSCKIVTWTKQTWTKHHNTYL